MKIDLLKPFIATVILLNLCPGLNAKEPEKKVYKSRDHYYAAATPGDLNRLAQYELAGNQAAIQRMVKNKQLTVLKQGEEYNKDLTTPNMGQVIRVKSKDGKQTYWTTKDALVGGDR